MHAAGVVEVDVPGGPGGAAGADRGVEVEPLPHRVSEFQSIIKSLQ